MIQFLESWLETPYAAGQCCRGEGVDCVRFVNAGLAYGHGLDAPPDLPRFSQDSAFHEQGIVRELMDFWRKLYKTTEEDVGSRPRLGDVLVVASGISNQTHVCIDGGNGFIYHAIAPSVCRSSRQEFKTRIKRVFRPTGIQ